MFVILLTPFRVPPVLRGIPPPPATDPFTDPSHTFFEYTRCDPDRDECFFPYSCECVVAGLPVCCDARATNA